MIIHRKDIINQITKHTKETENTNVVFISYEIFAKLKKRGNQNQSKKLLFAIILAASYDAAFCVVVIVSCVAWFVLVVVRVHRVMFVFIFRIYSNKNIEQLQRSRTVSNKQATEQKHNKSNVSIYINKGVSKNDET